MCHAQDLLDNRLIGEGSQIDPVTFEANVQQTIEDVVHMYRM